MPTPPEPRPTPPTPDERAVLVSDFRTLRDHGCDPCGFVPRAIACLEALERQATALPAAIAALELVLSDVLTTEHAAPCSADHYPNARCRCAWPEVRAAIDAALTAAQGEQLRLLERRQRAVVAGWGG